MEWHTLAEELQRMQGKIVFISSAKGGLGSVITESFLTQGATVIGASREISAADFPQANFTPLTVDLTNPSEVRLAIGKVIADHGRLDVLVHVLGGFAGGDPITATTDKTWEKMRKLNLDSAFYVLREAIPHLRKSSNGRIVAIGSLAAEEPHANLGAYVIFKTALTTLIQTVALENADAGVTANVVLPATMDTPGNRAAMPQEDVSKWVQPQDVANLVLWLADDSARHVTGAAIPIEGGHA
jgi:NAD(P)-dependent dehydrogenase (short-subunit alcohol dehydrogenase family)